MIHTAVNIHCQIFDSRWHICIHTYIIILHLHTAKPIFSSTCQTAYYEISRHNQILLGNVVSTVVYRRKKDITNPFVRSEYVYCHATLATCGKNTRDVQNHFVKPLTLVSDGSVWTACFLHIYRSHSKLIFSFTLNSNSKAHHSGSSTIWQHS